MSCPRVGRGGLTPNHEQGAPCVSKGASRYYCRIRVLLDVNGKTKCDEVRPCCNNCAQRAVSCHYTPKAPPSSSSTPSSTNERRDPKKRPGRPRKFPRSPEANASKSTAKELDVDVGFASCETGPASGQHFNLDLDDFELLHHYYTSTWSTFSSDTPIQSLYRTSIPQMALKHPFVLRLLLALAGQHVRYLRSGAGCIDEADRCAILAESHFCAAVPQVKLLFSDLTRDTCQVAYISAMLVCMHLLARGPMPGEYLVFSEQGSPLWIGLLQGVKHTKFSFGDLSFVWPATSETVLPPITNEATVTSFCLPRVHWQNALRDLNSFIVSDVESESREIYCAAFEALTQTFQATYGSDKDGSYNGDPLQQIVFRWLYILDDQMVEKLQRKDPHALIMIGHYAVLLRIPELVGCWFVQGWSYHLLKGIYAILEEDRHRCWLKWPFRTVGLTWEMP
ncbi:hypothetical protein PMIN07_009009 [Paraphaeosphaeria minitans]